ncbi:unnamed protein product [Haemonchus placei]|uniref:EB domain-containing protein n=1 Tax=Haemonchus placei TaxID=6290 RepID=A0A0N4XBY5_HAEPC|nr:unnamed protein product [Haemonchus placei]
MNCHGGNENRFVTEAQCNRFCQGSACAAGEAVAVTPEGVPLICHKPSICPQGYKCVYNKLFNRHHCCGFPNNGGVCPVDSVSYTSLATGAALRCIPSARSDSCPEGFICVGKGQSVRSLNGVHKFCLNCTTTYFVLDQLTVPSIGFAFGSLMKE